MNATHAAAATSRRAPRVDVPLHVQPSARVPAASDEEVRDLIAAAGPLTLCDIAGGLSASAAAAATCVRRMLRARQLRRDEFGRYQLREAAAMS